MDHIDIVFDGPPGHESGRFVEVEDSFGRSIYVGEWVQREDGFRALRLKQSDAEFVPVRSKESPTPMLYDIYVRVAGQPTWIGSRRTLEQCALAAEPYTKATA
jgi:hypothetical protein